AMKPGLLPLLLLLLPPGPPGHCRLASGHTKPGVCPKRRVLHTFAPCNSSCSDDTDCPHREKCCPVSSGDICHLPPVHGPCRGLFRRYAYNPATGTCQPFIYGGCQGNANNFRTVEECQQCYHWWLRLLVV
uniref:BPTI/Kunitz inhibitor domain-containing protein n=1 Tax=Falco tinnunculus TaxID=100819 RepID=A0A8C4TV41_FALTI